MNVISVAPYRVLPPTDGGKQLIYGSSIAMNKLADHFSCIAVSTLREKPLSKDQPFQYQEFRSRWSFLIVLERTHLFPNLPYIESFRFMTRRLAKECLKHNPDVVEVHLPWLTAIRKYLPDSTKVVLLTQNVEAMWYQASIEQRLFPRFFKRRLASIEAEALRMADHVIALTQGDKQEFVRRYAINPDKISVIPAGYDPAICFPGDQSNRSDTKRALFVGSRYSGNLASARTIIERIAPACGQNTEILIAGSVCRSIKSLPLPSNVKLLGYVDDLAALLRSCHVFINPSNMETGINMKVIDALGCGLRVVATGNGARGYADLVGSAIITCAIEEFAEHISESSTLNETEMNQVKAYEWPRLAQRRLNLYSRIKSG